MTIREHAPGSFPAPVMNRAVATRLASVLLAVVRKDIASPPAPVGQSASPTASPPGPGVAPIAPAGRPVAKVTDAEATRIASERVRIEHRDVLGRWTAGGAKPSIRSGSAANQIGAVRDARRIASSASDLASRLVALRPPDHLGRVRISHPEHLALSRLSRAERGLGPGGFTHQVSGPVHGGVVRGTLPNGLQVTVQGSSTGPVAGPFNIHLPRGFGTERTGYQPVYPANPVNQLLLAPELRDRILEQQARTDRQQQQFDDAERRLALREAAYRDASAFRMADDSGNLDAHPDSHAYHATVRPELARQALVDAGYGLDRPGTSSAGSGQSPLPYASVAAPGMAPTALMARVAPIASVPPVVAVPPMAPMAPMTPVTPMAVLPSMSRNPSSRLVAVPLAAAEPAATTMPESSGGTSDDVSGQAARSVLDASGSFLTSQQVSQEAAAAAAAAYPAQVLEEWNHQVENRWRVGTAGNPADVARGTDAAGSLTHTLGGLYDMLQTAHAIGSDHDADMAASAIRHAVPDDAVADALAGSLLTHPAPVRHDAIAHALGQHLRETHGITVPRRDRNGDRIPRIPRAPRVVPGGSVLDSSGATALAHALLGNGGSGLPDRS